MHDIYSYIPVTSHVSSVYSVAAVLYVQFLLHFISHFFKLSQQNMHCVGLICDSYITVHALKYAKFFISPVKYVLYPHISTCRSLCAVPNMAVFCSTLIWSSTGMLVRYCLTDSVGSSCPHLYWDVPHLTLLMFAFQIGAEKQ